MWNQSWDYIAPGLVWLLGFWLVLMALGYPWLIALSFAVLAGVAGGLVTAWWQTPPDPSRPDPFDLDALEPLSGDRPRQQHSYETFASSRRKRQQRPRRQEALLSRLMRRGR